MSQCDDKRLLSSAILSGQQAIFAAVLIGLIIRIDLLFCFGPVFAVNRLHHCGSCYRRAIVKQTMQLYEWKFHECFWLWDRMPNCVLFYFSIEFFFIYHEDLHLGAWVSCWRFTPRQVLSMFMYNEIVQVRLSCELKGKNLFTHKIKGLLVVIRCII